MRPASSRRCRCPRPGLPAGRPHARHRARGDTKPLGSDKTPLALARGTWDGKALTSVNDFFIAEGAGGAARVAFGRDGSLYMTTGGGAGDGAQDGNNHGGKVLRLKDDGTTPADNPFAGKPGYKPEVFTLGHRNSMGLALHPGTGEMWQNENGPSGGDEIDVLHAGRNYGWPISSYGRTYPGTGHLERILFNEKMEELRRESLLVPLRQRIRDVWQGPDELLYLLTDANDGAVLRIEAAS